MTFGSFWTSALDFQLGFLSAVGSLPNLKRGHLKQKNAVSFPFFFGTFISSLGSQTLMISLMAFMKVDGYSLWQIGFTIGLIRFSGIIINLVFGDAADRLSAKKLVLWTEIAAAGLSFVLMALWRLGPPMFHIFVGCAVLRGCILAVQGPGKNKISKLLSSPGYASNSRQAIWLNKVNYGTVFFAAGFSWLAVSFFSFYAVIAFDAMTFLANGLIIWKYLDLPTTQLSRSEVSFRFMDKFRHLYHYCRWAAIFDLLLTVSLCGGNVFSVRFAGTEERWIPIFLASYGLAIWTTGYLQRIVWVQRRHALFWLGLSLSFFLLARFPERGIITLLCFVINDHFYWLLYHKYSAQIQTDTPIDHMAAVGSARAIQMMVVIVAGEFAVGGWSKVIPVHWEAIWRGIFSLAVILVVMVRVNKMRVISPLYTDGAQA